MALNSTGPISIGGSTTGQSINLELGRTANATSSMNETALRTLAGVASGAISLSNFYGKSNAVSVEWTMLLIGGGGASIGQYSTTNDDGTAQYPMGGGGAGGLLTTSGSNNSGSSLYLVVGAGASAYTFQPGSPTYYSLTSGGAAVTTAIGGGTSGAGPSYTSVPNGGSGAGSTYVRSVIANAAGTGTSGQGNNGGTAVNSGGQGGGGGKNSVGGNGSGSTGGVGGTGYDLALFKGGTANIVAYGGGGSSVSNINIIGAGNNGSSTYLTTQNAPSNTGGGARGASSPVDFGSSYTGGSGRIIIRYPGTTAKATGGTTYTATVGGTAYFFHEFTASGTLTFT